MVDPAEVLVYVLRGDHKKVPVEGFYSREFVLDCHEDSGQHRRKAAIGGLRPAQKSDKTPLRQRMQQVVEGIPFPPDAAGSSAGSSHRSADKTTPCPQPSLAVSRVIDGGSRIEYVQRVLESPAPSLWIGIETILYQLNAKRRHA